MATDARAETAAFADARSGPDAPQTADATDAVRIGLHGAFLELTNERSESYWKAAVAEMAALGMRTVWVQTESYLTPGLARNAVDRSKLRAVLDEAQRLGMTVHLGLVLAEWGNGDSSKAQDANFVASVTAASKTSVDLLWSDFAPYAASGVWVACYLPLELWTPGSVGELGALPGYVRDSADYVKRKTALQVSMSPFISALATDRGEATRVAFSALFSSAKVDIVALQDGVGARGLAAADLAYLLPFYQAMKDACTGRCELWANAESFAGDFTTPAPWPRFRAQLETLSAVTQKIVTYEYASYWFAQGPAGAQGKALHDAYASWYAAP